MNPNHYKLATEARKATEAPPLKRGGLCYEASASSGDDFL